MVSYYSNCLSMFPPHHQSRSAPPGGTTAPGSAPGPLGYPGYHHSYQPGGAGYPSSVAATTPDQNSNLHLYSAAAAAQFDFTNSQQTGVGSAAAGWPANHTPSWSPSRREWKHVCAEPEWFRIGRDICVYIVIVANNIVTVKSLKLFQYCTL